MERANAHPAGARPFVRENYVKKFDMLTESIITKEERNRFIGLVENLSQLSHEEICALNVEVPEGYLVNSERKGIFE